MQFDLSVDLDHQYNISNNMMQRLAVGLWIPAENFQVGAKPLHLPHILFSLPCHLPLSYLN